MILISFHVANIQSIPFIPIFYITQGLSYEFLAYGSLIPSAYLKWFQCVQCILSLNR